MNTWFDYIISVNLTVGVCAAGWFLILRHSRRLGTNRAVLLSLVVLPMLLPLINFAESAQELFTIILPPFVVQAGGEFAAVSTTGTSVIEWIGTIYIVGMGVAVVLFAWRLLQMIRLIHQAERVGRLMVVKSPKIQSPASFGRVVFLPEGLESDAEAHILRHESAHALHYHTIDLLYNRILLIICWPNPLAYYLSRASELNLEYLADRAAVKPEGALQTYPYVLLGQAMGVQPTALMHHFSKSKQLKKRIMMMNQKPGGGLHHLYYLGLIPVLAMAIAVQSCTKEATTDTEPPLQILLSEPDAGPDENGVYRIVEVMPEYPGGINELIAYLSQNVKYPPEVKSEGIRGMVVTSFVIDENGAITDIEWLNKGVVDERLAAAAIRTIEGMPEWTAGKHEGQNVKVKMVLPIQFSLKEGDK